MSPPVETPHKGGIPSSPSLRLQITRDAAISHFGSESAADAWLGRNVDSILEGEVSVRSACQTAVGFSQAITELASLRSERVNPKPDESWSIASHMAQVDLRGAKREA